MKNQNPRIKKPKSRKPVLKVRVGWAEAARQMAAHGKTAAVLPEFPNEFDTSWTW